MKSGTWQQLPPVPLDQVPGRLPPAPQTTQAPGRALGIAAIVCGVIGFLILPVVFGPVAVILGVIAVAQGYRAAWVGLVLGSVELFIVAKAFFELSQALESL